MSNVEHHARSYRFTEPEEQRFLEKMERLESRLDGVEQEVLRIFSEMEIPNSWLEEWDEWTAVKPNPGEGKVREWVENHLKKLAGFGALDELEQKKMVSLYHDALYFIGNVLKRQEELSGMLTDEERAVLQYVRSTLRNDQDSSSGFRASSGVWDFFFSRS